MDPLAHTAFVLVVMFIANVIGKRMGRQEGITAAVTYLLEMGVLTDEDLKKANERFMDGDDI